MLCVLSGRDTATRRKESPPRAAKDLIWFVRICCFGALIRGLQNLGTPLKGFNCCGAKLRLRCAESMFAKPRCFCEGVRVVTFCIVQKVTKKHAGRSPATHDSKLCRKRFCRKFRRLVSKPVLSAKRRRKGFESVQKGYRSAEARLIFFENGLLYCKLTVGFRG